jgi:hypothetical protein
MILANGKEQIIRNTIIRTHKGKILILKSEGNLSDFLRLSKDYFKDGDAITHSLKGSGFQAYYPSDIDYFFKTAF